jgi:hypothetical protein
MPVRGILVMAALTVPFSLMDFGWLVQWSGLLGVITQVIQGIIFLLLRTPWSMRRISTRGAQRLDEATLDGSSGTGYTAGSSMITVEKVLDDDKFIIGGGWPVAILVSLSLFASSGVLCYVSGWQSLIVSAGLVLAMVLFKGIEIGNEMLVEWCRRRFGRRDDSLNENLGQQF